MNGNFCLKRKHAYYFQVQQQLFTLSDRRFCDFVVCGIDHNQKPQIVKERIFPDKEHWKTALAKLEAFWRICILPEILGRWYTRRCVLPEKAPGVDGTCFCRAKQEGDMLKCSNEECPYVHFHRACLTLSSAEIPKTWYCP